MGPLLVLYVHHACDLCLLSVSRTMPTPLAGLPACFRVLCAWCWCRQNFLHTVVRCNNAMQFSGVACVPVRVTQRHILWYHDKTIESCGGCVAGQAIQRTPDEHFQPDAVRQCVQRCCQHMWYATSLCLPHDLLYHFYMSSISAQGCCPVVTLPRSFHHSTWPP